MAYKRQLSSDATILLKVLFPIVFYSVFLFGTISLFYIGEFWGGLAMLAGSSIFGLLIWIGLVKLMIIHIDDDFIYVSNFLRTSTIPIKNLEDVTDTWLLNYHPIWLHFSSQTAFGSTVMFMPKTRLSGLFSTHPIANELRTIIKEKKTQQ